MTAPTPSLQLYTVRSQLDADLHGTLQRLTDIGLRNVEAFRFVAGAADLAVALAAHDLAAPTGHAMLVAREFTFNGVTIAVPTHRETFGAAQKLGMTYVIDPAAFDFTTREAIAATAEGLNRAAETAADFGVRVGYHNHAWEIQNVIDGTIGLEVLADLLDDDVVLEIDLYWAYVGGANVPALLGRLGDRVRALHIKDGPRVPNPFLTHAFTDLDPVALDQTAAGEGDVPLRESIAAAPSAEYAVIEFDAYAGDIFDAIADSYNFLTRHS